METSRFGRRTTTPARPDVVLLQRRAVRVARLRARIIDALCRLVRHARRPGSRSCWTTTGWTWPSPAERPTTAWSAAARACGSPPAGPHLLHRRGGGGGRAATAPDRSPARRRTPVSALPSPLAVCLVPAGVEPGQDVDLTERRFDLLVSEPVEFPLYVSSTRLTDRPGDLVPARSRADDAAAAHPHRAADAEERRGGNRLGQPPCPADRDRHARPVVQRDRRAGGVGGCNSTSARPRRPTWPPTSRRPRARDSSTRPPGRSASRPSTAPSAPTGGGQARGAGQTAGGRRPA